MNPYNLPCNIAQTLNIIGDKWSLLILHKLFESSSSYKEIKDSLDGIPTNLLSERLKFFENCGLIKSELYQPHPPRYKYFLTERGNDLEDIFNSIIIWGEKHLNKCYKKIVHNKCGHCIELKYYCKNCKREISRNELNMQSINNENNF